MTSAELNKALTSMLAEPTPDNTELALGALIEASDEDYKEAYAWLVVIAPSMAQMEGTLHTMRENARW